MNSCRLMEWLSEMGETDIWDEPMSIQAVQKSNVVTLQELRALMEQVDSPLKQCATNMVFGVGNEHANVLLLGEAPGAEEDKQGLPFVGQSGQLLDKMLAAIGLDRIMVYITNILPWRPPGNRTPTSEEIALFLPYVLKHISIISPKIVVCLGGTATKALLQKNDGIVRLRGRWTKVEGMSARVIATFHPAYLLRSPSQKREAWIDFLQIKSALASIN